MKKIELVLWFRCNCRCLCCVVDERVAGQSMSTAAAVRHLAVSRKAGARDVDFGGGEPTLREDLPALAQAAAKLGYRKIGVKTNGLRLCYPEFVARLMRAGVNQFTFPIRGHVPEVHDRLARTPGAFEMMEMAVKHAVDFGAEAEAEVLLTTETVPHLRELIGHFTAIGLRRFRMYFFSLFASDQTMPELLPSLTSAGRAIVAAVAASRRDKASIYTTHVPYCFLRPYPGIYSSSARAGLDIITPGGSFPNAQSPFEAGRKTARCAGCAKYALCAGVRPEYLERFSDREIRPL